MTSTCVASGGEVALLDPIAPRLGAQEIWKRLDARPPTLVVLLKPDHVPSASGGERHVRVGVDDAAGHEDGVGVGVV